VSKPTLCAILSAAAIFAQHQAPDRPDEAAAGERMFRRQCSACHGRNAQGGRAPDLTRGGRSEEELAQIISQGVPGTEMLAYRDRMTPEHIRSIVTYISASNRDESLLKGNAARGQELYWAKGNCGTCHAVGDRGTRVGPDLSRTVALRSFPYLRESVASLGTALTPAHSFVTVVTRDGKTIHGIQRFLDDFSLILTDQSGVNHSVDRSTLKSVEKDVGAHAFASTLSSAEIDDLIAYLWMLRQPPSTLSRDRKSPEVNQ
jgi:putative heme-binding domain-containing protein